MAAAAPIELVIFDCDGVLVDSEVISNRVIVQGLAAIGCPLDEATVGRRFVGRSYQTMARELEAELGRPLPERFVENLEAATLDLLARELQPTRGIAAALARLDRQRCVASSSSVAWIDLCLERTGLSQLVGQHRFSASMVAHGKPAPDLFLHAAATLGVAPAQCLVIEDSEPGLQAGLAAAMRVVGFVGGSHVPDAALHADRLRTLGAAATLADLADLPLLVADLAGG